MCGGFFVLGQENNKFVQIGLRDIERLVVTQSSN